VVLSKELSDKAKQIVQAALAEGKTKSENNAAREARPSTEGLLLLYPISRHSGYDSTQGGLRRRLFDNPDGPLARDLVGLAISFPQAAQPQQVEAYLEGTARWRRAE